MTYHRYVASIALNVIAAGLFIAAMLATHLSLPLTLAGFVVLIPASWLAFSNRYQNEGDY